MHSPKYGVYVCVHAYMYVCVITLEIHFFTLPIKWECYVRFIWGHGKLIAQIIDIMNNEMDVRKDNDVGGKEVGNDIGGNWAAPYCSPLSFYLEKKAKPLRLFSKRTQVWLWEKFWHLPGNISSFREGHGSSLSFFVAPILRQYPQGVSVSSSIFTSVKKDLGLEIS